MIIVLAFLAGLGVYLVDQFNGPLGILGAIIVGFTVAIAYTFEN